LLTDIQTPSIWQIGTFIFLILAFWVIQRFALNPLLQKFALILKDKEYNVQYEFLHHYNKPLRYVFLFTGLYVSLSYLFGMNLWKIEALGKLFDSFLILCGFLGVYHLLSYYAVHPAEWKLFNKEKMNEAIFPFLCRFGKVAVFFLAFTVVSAQWGYNMNGFIAGLGIGGIALALGAKDVLSNIFGGTAVVLDKPFAIGDVISTEDKRLQGIVEDINFRSTRLQTFEKEIIYVPNSLLANQPIYNYSRRDRRRVRFHLGLSLDTPGIKVRNVIDDIKSSLIEHEGVDSQSFNVFFDEYTQTSLDILIVYFTNSADYTEYIKIKEGVNFIVMNILKNHEATLAPAIQHMNYNRNILQ